MTTTLVVCIGNDLVADDGVGHAVFAALSHKKLPSGTTLKLLGLGGMSLLDKLDGEDHLIVVDAVQLGKPPGTVDVMDWSEIPQSQSQVSCHGIGIREAIEVSRKLYPEKTPERVHLVGIEGQCFDQLGEGLTEEVAAAVAPAVAEVIALIGGSGTGNLD